MIKIMISNLIGIIIGIIIMSLLQINRGEENE